MSNETEREQIADIEIIDMGNEEGEKENEPKKESKIMLFFKEMFELAINIVVTMTILILLKEYVIINAYIPSGSMEHTIMPKDRIIGNRLAYLKEEPERGDIVIFKYPDDEEQLFVKRIIGLPGETVTILDAKVYIGEEMVRLEETYLKEEWIVDNGPYTFVVPEESYLMLGDNRNNSKDSRYWINTYVEEEDILGEAVFRYWPLKDIGILE